MSAPGPRVNVVAPVNRLLLLDGHSLAYRAFYALPPENFSTKTGQTTNAVYGFTSMLINMLRDEEPSHIGVAFDLSRQTFRSEEYAEYKAGRSSTPTEFSGQIPLIHEVLDALRIRYVEAQGYEADDIIATLTTQATAKEMEVVIVSGDRDVFQLVAEHVDEHRREAVDGVGRLTGLGREVLRRQGVEGAVCQRVAVEEQEPVRRCHDVHPRPRHRHRTPPLGGGSSPPAS